MVDVVVRGCHSTVLILRSSACPGVSLIMRLTHQQWWWQLKRSRLRALSSMSRKENTPSSQHCKLEVLSAFSLDLLRPTAHLWPNHVPRGIQQAKCLSWAQMFQPWSPRWKHMDPRIEIKACWKGRNSSWEGIHKCPLYPYSSKSAWFLQFTADFI